MLDTFRQQLCGYRHRTGMMSGRYPPGEGLAAAAAGSAIDGEAFQPSAAG
jgi:hypothetical protein